MIASYIRHHVSGCFQGGSFQKLLLRRDVTYYRYERFHAATLEEVRTYPELVLKELEVYDNALCQYLGVSRTPLKVYCFVYSV